MAKYEEMLAAQERAIIEESNAKQRILVSISAHPPKVENYAQSMRLYTAVDWSWGCREHQREEDQHVAVTIGRP
jgi:hypothetical protein